MHTQYMKEIKITAQDRAVKKLLDSLGIKTEIFYQGESHENDWHCDCWRVQVFKNGSLAFETEFKTGIGHRTGAVSYTYGDPNIPKKAKLTSSVKEFYNGKTVFHKIIENNNFLAITPTDASVFYSLLSDADCGSESFTGFCDNFGYSNDSLHALDVYRACEKMSKDINKLFSNEDRESLREALEDY